MILELLQKFRFVSNWFAYNLLEHQTVYIAIELDRN